MLIICQEHELKEEVDSLLEASRKRILGSSSEFAMNSAHGVAFHRGLGNPLYPMSHTPITKYVSSPGLAAYSKAAFAKSNFAVVANGAEHKEFSKWISQFFTESPATPPPEIPERGTSPTKYHGGEERIALDKGNTIVVGFPGSSSFAGGSWKPEMAVLATLLGGQSTIKWSPGFSLLSKATEAYPQAHISTTHHTYSDAGLLTVEITGIGNQVREASFEIVKALKSVAAGHVGKEEIKRAVATAKFQALDSGQNIDTGLELTGAGLIQGGKAYQLDEIGKSIGAVTEDQVKKVGAVSLLEPSRWILIIHITGCEITSRWQSISVDRWGLISITFRGGAWSECLKLILLYIKNFPQAFTLRKFSIRVGKL